MVKSRVKSNLSICFIIFCLICLNACVTTSHTYEENVYKALNMAATTYENTMQTVGDAYKKGLFDDSVKNKIIEKANIYWKTYHSAVLAYEIYLRQKTSENKNKLDSIVQNMDTALVELLTISQKNIE